MTQHALPIINPLLEISDFDSDAGKPMKLCLIPRVSGDGEVRLALPAEYMELAWEFDGHRDMDGAIQSYIDKHGPNREKTWLTRLVVELLMPKGIIIRADQDPRCATSSQSDKVFLHVKLPIISAGIVEPVAKSLAFLYRPAAMLFGLLTFIAMHVYVYGFLFRGQHFEFSQFSITSVLLLMLLSTLATICHEFGHATAAAHFGCRNMTIGWGVYLIYTVLWTNVSDAWKLPKKDRAIVDIGGVYFESFFLLALLAAYQNTSNPIFLFGFIFVDLSIANTFNPFLRMDGYWLVSDLFGIVNLRKQQEIWWRDLLTRLFRPSDYRQRSTLKPIAKRVLAVYTVLGTLFIAYVMKTMFVVVVLSVLTNLPSFFDETWQKLASDTTWLTVLRALMEIAWRILVILGAGFTFWNVGKAIVRMLGRMRHVARSAEECI
jgi:putative peptide zinc metalloprotease protein